MDYSDLIEFCETDWQRTVVETIIEKGNQRKAAKVLDRNIRNIERLVERLRKKAALRGHAPEYDMTHKTAPGFLVKGTSTLYNEDGQVKSQWVKTKVDEEKLQEIRNEVIRAMSDEIKREKPVESPIKHLNSDLLNLYVITDYHFGQSSWAEETGDNWDLKIAENLLVKWFEAAIKSSPDAEYAVLGQLGDLVHFDSLEAITPTNHHVLDADSRFSKVVRVVIRTMRRVIGMLLEKHKYVHLIMAEGNHDLASSVWLREWMGVLYENDPRITVDLNPDPYYCYEHGKTSLFFHHGHKRRPGDIDAVFAAKFREVFGRTKYSFAHLGHMHHVDQRDTNLMLVTQHRTLAAKDAHSSRGGWMSGGREAKVITYHKEFGQVGEISISPEMVE